MSHRVRAPHGQPSPAPCPLVPPDRDSDAAAGRRGPLQLSCGFRKRFRGRGQGRELPHRAGKVGTRRLPYPRPVASKLALSSHATRRAAGRPSGRTGPAVGARGAPSIFLHQGPGLRNEKGSVHGKGGIAHAVCSAAWAPGSRSPPAVSSRSRGDVSRQSAASKGSWGHGSELWPGSQATCV